jgi:LysM repeat protein
MSDEELLSRGLRRIKAGDTLGMIARQMDLKPADIITLNPGLDPTRLRIGQILRIRADGK